MDDLVKECGGYCSKFEDPLTTLEETHNEDWLKRMKEYIETKGDIEHFGNCDMLERYEIKIDKTLYTFDLARRGFTEEDDGWSERVVSSPTGITTVWYVAKGHYLAMLAAHSSQ